MPVSGTLERRSASKSRDGNPLILRPELIMMLGAIVESIRTVLERQTDNVQVHREAGETLIRVFVGKQLFVLRCSEAAPDKESPAIT